MGLRRRGGAFAALVLVVALAGCTHVVEDSTDDLLGELLGFDVVTGGYASSRDDTLFDDPFSSIQLDVTEDATADELDDLVTYWRFGVDGIDARWMLGLTRPGGDGYDDFSVVGVRSVADLTTMVRFWHDAAQGTGSADVSIDDYSDTTDGSIRFDLGTLESASLHEFVLPLQQQAFALPGRFQWSVDAAIPAGTVSVASTNVLPDAHMLDMLALLAAPPTVGDPGPIWFWAIESNDPFQPGEPLRLDVGVYLEPPGIEEGDPDLGAHVLADPVVWPVILELVDRLPADETVVTLDVSVHGDQVAHLDPLTCTRENSEDVYGPLNFDVWQHWSGRDCDASR